MADGERVLRIISASSSAFSRNSPAPIPMRLGIPFSMISGGDAPAGASHWHRRVEMRKHFSLDEGVFGFV
jgi:hypothetical protein